jgi:RNA polymerase sigma-70 factor (ECF subfamily)
VQARVARRGARAAERANLGRPNACLLASALSRREPPRPRTETPTRGLISGRAGRFIFGMPPECSEAGRWYREFLQPHEAMLRAWLCARFTAGQEVDDIVQESVCRVLAARERGEVRSPKAFFFATARNLVVGNRRKAVRQGQFLLADLDELGVLDDTAEVAATVARAEELELLTRAIQSLPPRCRQVITLRKIYGLSEQEIARELGVSVNTVETQATLGMKKLFAFLGRHTDRPSR